MIQLRDASYTRVCFSLNSGSLKRISADIQSGALTAAGLITSPVTNAALISPGTAITTTTTIGILRITGDYTQTATSLLYYDVAGKAAGSFNQL